MPVYRSVNRVATVVFLVGPSFSGCSQPDVIIYGGTSAAVTAAVQAARIFLVPVALSASHIAFGSIRMEPVFMILEQSATTAAVLAIENDQTVQHIEYEELKEQLLENGQILEYN